MSNPRGNAQTAATLDEYAALLELAGAGPWSARAYRRAARLIRELPVPVDDLVRGGRVRELRGIGPGIEARLAELVETGRIAELEELKQSTSPELVALGRMLGFGPRLATAIGETLGVRSAEQLETAARAGRLRDVPGIGPRTEAKIVAALDAAPRAARNALTLERAQAETEAIAEGLGGHPAGAARRWVDAIDRLAVVVATTEPDDVRARFAALPQIVTTLSPDEGLTRDGIPVDLVLAPPGALGTALVRATGAPAYVASLGPLPDAPDEAGVYRLLDREPVPPELREPDAPVPPSHLLGLDDIRGDLHCHTTWSDGRATVREMAEAARARGYAYLAICDHTTAVRVVPGLDADAVRRQRDEIAAANEQLAPLRVLHGIECDIRVDGSLDLPDDVLAELDWVQISLHAGQRAPRRELTARVVEAMHHPSARCLSHPTGRLIGHRPENALDLERTIEASLRTGVALEVNGLPDRLDLSAEHARTAIEAGVALVCSTDAHSVAGLDRMSLSVHTARRAGAGRGNVLNTLPVDQLLAR
ncbi:MAG TPA: PHP domain-containing protein [Gaiellaceae bacterium]